MGVFIHIGPPKTATTSLQNSIMPHLGLPFEVGPEWTRRIARADIFCGPIRLDPDLIVSDETLGDYARFPPEIIADRLSTLFRQATILYCVRDPLELFYSLYRQRLVNEAGLQAKAISQGKTFQPASPAQFLAHQWSQYCAGGTGFFAASDLDLMRAAFEPRFSFKTLDFALLTRDAQAFARTFADACGRRLTAVLSWDNPTILSKLDAALEHRAFNRGRIQRL